MPKTLEKFYRNNRNILTNRYKFENLEEDFNSTIKSKNAFSKLLSRGK